MATSPPKRQGSAHDEANPSKTPRVCAQDDGHVDAHPPIYLTTGHPVETTDTWWPKDKALSGAELADRETVPCPPQSADERCSVCLGTFEPLESEECVRLKRCPTQHCFHKECISNALGSCPRCPNCLTFVAPPKGTQPIGKMIVVHRNTPLPGEQASGMYVIWYQFPSGIQGPEHPSPGEPYSGTSRRAFLPDSDEGFEVLRKLMMAWDARLLFTIGTSITTGYSNTVVWNGIHHKTNISGGSLDFGYPDSTYLKRVELELAAAGIY